MKTSEVLRRARGLIEDGSRWTKGNWHADGQFCVLGAVGSVIGDPNCYPNGHPAVRTLAAAAPDHLWRRDYDDRLLDPQRKVWRVNDEGTHDDVLAMVDRAIEFAEAEEQEQTYGDPLPDLEPERVLA